MKLCLHLLAQSLLCLGLFSRNGAALYFGYDGAYMRQLMRFHFDWVAWTPDLTLNPFQGLGNIAFPVNYWFSPASLLTYALSGDALSPVLIYTFTTLEFFASIWLLAAALGASQRVQIGASWLSCALVMPFIVPPYTGFVIFYPVSGLVPWIVEHFALSNLILVLLARAHSAPPMRSLSATALAAAGVFSSVIAFPHTTILAVPLVASFFAFSVASSRPSFTRSGAGKAMGLAVGLTLTLPMLFAAGLLIYSVPTFFNKELIYGRPTWVFVSLLFHGPLRHGWVSSLVFLAGIGGGFLALRDAGQPLGTWARFYLVYSLGLVGLGVLLTFGITSYRGPSMLYFEWFVWPLMFIYGCRLLEWLLQQGARYCESGDSPWQSRGARVMRLLGSIPCSLLIPALVVGLILLCDKPKAMRTQFWPIKPTEITEYLRERVALTPGSAWRGSVATFTGINASGTGTNWYDNFGAHDVSLWAAVGNDHRATGLWWYGIPTLFSYNQYMTPDYYLLMTRLFATPQDAQQRSVIVLTKPNAKLLRLFGVRYVITETPLPDDSYASPRNTFQWVRPCKAGRPCDQEARHQQLLYELASPNLGDYSPTRQIIEPTAAGGISRMQASDFDPRSEVILQHPVSDALVQAAAPRLYQDEEGLQVQAQSSAASLLLLPLQYTACLDLTANRPDAAGTPPRLVRADIGLTGVWFAGNLDARIRLKFGVLSNVGCRIRDYLDGRRMALGHE